MPATSADISILATGRPVRIPTPDGKIWLANYDRNFRTITLDVPLSTQSRKGDRLSMETLCAILRHLPPSLAAVQRCGICPTGRTAHYKPAALTIGARPTVRTDSN